MKRTTINVLFNILFLLFISSPGYAFDNYIDRDMRSAFDTEANGRIVISKNYDYSKKGIAISMEWGPTYEQVMFQYMLSQEYMANGYIVVERLQFEQVLRELALDQTGAVAQKEKKKQGSSDESTRKSEPLASDMSKNDLKKLGEILGISHLVYFRVIDEDFVFLRSINLETAEIDLSASIKMQAASVKYRVIIKSIVNAIAASSKMPNSTKDLLVSYVKHKPLLPDASSSFDKKNIIYQDDEVAIYLH